MRVVLSNNTDDTGRKSICKYPLTGKEEHSFRVLRFFTVSFKNESKQC